MRSNKYENNILYFICGTLYSEADNYCYITIKERTYKVFMFVMDIPQIFLHNYESDIQIGCVMSCNQLGGIVR